MDNRSTNNNPNVPQNQKLKNNVASSKAMQQCSDATRKRKRLFVRFFCVQAARRSRSHTTLLVTSGKPENCAR